MIYTKAKSLILLMITALFCISGNLTFADQEELDSRLRGNDVNGRFKTFNETIKN